MAASLIKASLILCTAACYNIGFTPPQPITSEGDKVYKPSVFEHVAMLMVYASRIFVTVLAIANTAIVVLLYEPSLHSSPIFSNICPFGSPTLDSLSTMSPAFILGVTLVVLSTSLRVRCFSTLGSLFTFRVTIKPDHSLVTTGPYAYVRHPSYTAGTMLLAGALTVVFSTGNYMDECGINLTPIKWITCLWIVCCAFTVMGCVRRGKLEDRLLKETFGKRWEEYSHAVPYSFVPSLL